MEPATDYCPHTSVVEILFLAFLVVMWGNHSLGYLIYTNNDLVCEYTREQVYPPLPSFKEPRPVTPDPGLAYNAVYS